MSFKDKYTEYQSKIAPDKEFLEQLAIKMERQKQSQKKRPKVRMIFISTASVCASAAAALLVILNLPKPQPNPVRITGDSSKFSYIVGVFANGEIFSNDRSIPEQLAQMLSDSKTTLYKNSENKFKQDDKLNEEQRKALAEKIKHAEETNSELGKNVDHYMMVLENGDVIKFRISGNVLEINKKNYKF